MIILLVVAGIGLFIFILYATVKTKSISINKYEPFRTWIGKTVTLNRQTILFKEQLNINDKYPYRLLDSLHPYWQWFSDRSTMQEPDAWQVTIFPVGSIVKIEKAIQYTNGVSGSSSPMLFGTMNDGKTTYKIGYQWGKQDISKDFDGIKKCWEFHQAPWQEKRDTAFYELPEAGWW